MGQATKTGIMLCGHGSRAKSAEEEFALLARGLRARYPDLPVEYGFLEYSAPNIHMGLARLRAAGVTVFGPSEAAARLDACTVDRTPRGWEHASDHTPVVMTLAG